IGKAAALEAGEAGARFVAVQDNVHSWVLRNLGRLEEADEWSNRALERSTSQPSAMSEMYYASRLDLIEGRMLARDLDAMRDQLDGVLNLLDRCGGLEAWRVTAELAAASRVDRWWRDAERRAGVLIANAGDHGETLRRYVGATFTGLGR